ncbi:MAG: hypothetical protein F6K44_20190 [Moorea sp. SIO3E2]|nr:hypothetical protein [Moorena sp. SIO3E2]
MGILPVSFPGGLSQEWLRGGQSGSLGGALRGDFRGEEVEHEDKPAPNTPYATARFPIPDSRFPIPYSLFPVPCSLFPQQKNSVKFWLIPMLDRIIFCNSQQP